MVDVSRQVLAAVDVDASLLESSLGDETEFRSIGRVSSESSAISSRTPSGTVAGSPVSAFRCATGTS